MTFVLPDLKNVCVAGVGSSLTAINLSLQANKLASKRKAHDDAEKAKKKARK